MRDGLIDFEDSNFDKLVETFIKKNQGLWEHHIIDEYTDECYRAEEMINDNREDR